MRGTSAGLTIQWDFPKEVSPTVRAGVDAEFSVEKTIEERKLIEAVFECYCADGFAGIAQSVADGLEAHLVAEGGKGLTGVQEKLTGEGRAAHAGSAAKWR
jgi:hypothetical protein